MRLAAAPCPQLKYRLTERHGSGQPMEPCGTALVLLGLGPVGGAFLLWDIGMKRGHIALLGVLSYTSPILSTGLLVVCGLVHPSARLALTSTLAIHVADGTSFSPLILGGHDTS